MINSHVHLIGEDSDEYAEALIQRMDENGVHACVLFGAQCQQAADDAAVNRIASRFPSRFIPFLSRSVDIARNDAFATCVTELEGGFWKGVGEIFLDCSNDMVVRWVNRNGQEQCVAKPVPEEKEQHPLYRALFEYCGTKKIPVLVHCMDAEVMTRTLQAYPDTTFIWAHADHGFIWDIPARLLEQHDNLVCEFGVVSRFFSNQILSGQGEAWLPDHVNAWRDICRHSPDRVIWGSDLFAWGDLEQQTFSRGIEVCHHIVDDLDSQLRDLIIHGNIARIAGCV